MLEDEPKISATDEELRRSEERFRLLVEGVVDAAIYMLDPAGRVTTWNSGAENIKGYTAREIVGQSFARFFTPEDVAAGRPARELEIAKKEGRFQEEGWRLRKDGSRFWANVVVTPIRDARGELLGFSKVTRDLSARRAAEETAAELVRVEKERAVAHEVELKLREERERYRALSRRLEVILEGVADGISVQAKSGALMYANTAAATVCGFSSAAELLRATPQEIMGRFEVFDEDGKPFEVERLPGRKVLAGSGSADAVMRVRDRASGRLRWCSVRASAVLGEDGVPELAVNIWHDITEQRRREEHDRYLARATATLSSSLDYQAMLSNLAGLLVPGLADWCAVHLVEGETLESVAVAHVDPDKVASARAYNEKYPPPRETRQGVWNVIRTGLSELYEKISEELLARGATSPEHLALLRDVGMRSVLIVPIRDRGRVIGTISLVSTEENRHYDGHAVELAEELGRRAGASIENAKLYAAEKSARQQLEVLAHAAEEASRIKDEFLATVSHELRTPLNAILGWASLLRNHSHAPSTAKGIEVIHRNAYAQAKIIDDILDVSRIITGKLRLELEPADLVAVARDAMEVVRPSAAAKRLSLDLVASADDCLLVADPDRLQQVIWNLLSNAVKFTDEGGRIEVAVWRRDASVGVTVSDTGSGISSDFLPYVFDRFKQADGSTTRRVGGLGLGLAIVRHIVELHGGRVEASSAGPGQGASFSMILPIRAVIPAPEGSGVPAATRGDSTQTRLVVSLQGLRVLVVDDEPDARDLLAAVLTGEGATVETAASAAAGFELFERHPPNVLVSDIGMRDEDGYAFMERIRALGPVGIVPSIALTAYTRAEDKTRALSAGFTTHIGKPVDPADLVAAVHNLARFSRPAGAV